MDMKTEPAEYRGISIRGSHLFIIPILDYIPYISSLILEVELSCARKIVKLKKENGKQSVLIKLMSLSGVENSLGGCHNDLHGGGISSCVTLM